jgi:hypothetical protein
MDDIGALCWRLGKKLIVSSAETEAAGHGSEHHNDPSAKGPPAAPPAMSPAAK